MNDVDFFRKQGREEEAVAGGIASQVDLSWPIWTPIGTFDGAYRYFEGFTSKELNIAHRGIKVWVAYTDDREHESFEYHFVKDEATGAFVYEVRNTPDGAPEITAGDFLDILPDRLARDELLPESVELPHSANSTRDLSEIVAIFGLNRRIQEQA